MSCLPRLCILGVPPSGDMNTKQMAWGVMGADGWGLGWGGGVRIGWGMVMVNAKRGSSVMSPKAMYSGSPPFRRHEHQTIGLGCHGG